MREHARAILSMLDKAKKEEVAGSRQQFEYAHPQAAQAASTAEHDEVDDAGAAASSAPLEATLERRTPRARAFMKASSRSASPATASSR